MEDIYICVRDIHSRFNSKIDDWTELLDTDQEGDPVFPEIGAPESRYSPDNEDLSRKTSQMEEVLNTTRDMLINFIISMSAAEQIPISQEAQLTFLKNLEVIKSHLIAKATGDNGDQDEEDNTDTVINGEDTGVNDEVPIVNYLTGEDSGVPILNPGGDNLVPTPSPSSRNSQGSCKPLRIEGKSY